MAIGYWLAVNSQRLKAKSKWTKPGARKYKTYIRKIATFLKYYVRFRKEEFYAKFDETIQPMTNTDNMGIEELIIEDAKAEAKLEGMELMLAIFDLLTKGEKPYDISQKLKVEEVIVLKAKDFLMKN